MSATHHVFWVTSRAAGSMALLLASASVCLGLIMTSRNLSISRRDLRTVHEWLSLTSLTLVGLHGVALLGDSYLKPGLSGIAIPFASSYRPLWTGVGVIAGYGLAVLGLSYYLRDRIGPARWKRLHRLTVVFWIAAIVHALGAGTDARQAWFLILAGALVLPAALLLIGTVVGDGGGGETFEGPVEQDPDAPGRRALPRPVAGPRRRLLRAQLDRR